MKVSAVMHSAVFTITEDALLKEAARLIFTLNIAGLPVVRGKKLVGIVTEQIILSKMHPSLGDLIDDYVHAKDFDSMIKNIHSVLEISVGEAMNPHVTTISPDAPIMQAHSLMQINKFSRLPVVDTKNKLLGVISQGDIFRTILKREIPQAEKERYAGFISKYYDQMIDWEKRYRTEFPMLFEVFKNENVKKILDLGTWTGEYTIELAKRKEFSILGLDNNPIMIKVSNEKKAKLSGDLRKRLNFALTDYVDIKSLTKDKFDAVVCMGNSLPYIPTNLDDLFKNLNKVLSSKAVAVIKLLNFEKILNSKNRLLNFSIHKIGEEKEKEQLSIEFFDSKDKSILLHNTIIFDHDGTNWIYKGITAIEIQYIKKEDLDSAFRKSGFREISFFGDNSEHQGEYGKLPLDVPFDPLQSDWLTVIAKK